MKTYRSNAVVDAEPMTRGTYNRLRGWTLPVDENPADPGYYIKGDNGYETWQPAHYFEQHYSYVRD